MDILHRLTLLRDRYLLWKIRRYTARLMAGNRAKFSELTPEQQQEHAKAFAEFAEEARQVADAQLITARAAINARLMTKQPPTP